MQDANCIFCRVVRGEIPSRKVYEDQEVLAFHDINPLAPVHFLIIPKAHIASMMELEEGHRNVFGKIMVLEEARDGWSRRPRYDVVIVDAPSTGHGLAFLKVPMAAEAAAPVGPIGANAAHTPKPKGTSGYE
jgi:diadenosine tetraphosphate (Ap4A) HIT family hydrolase